MFLSIDTIALFSVETSGALIQSFKINTQIFEYSNIQRERDVCKSSSAHSSTAYIFGDNLRVTVSAC